MIILVTGGGGFLGGHFLRVIPQGHEVVALVRNARAPHGTAIVEGDLSDPLKVEETLKIVEPTVIFHLGAVADASVCEKDPEYTQKVNVSSTGILAEYAARVGVPMLFCSTDLIFNGAAAPYGADAAPCPLMRYGAQKAEAEDLVRKICPDSIIARLPLMYGASGDGLLNHASRGMISPMLRNLRAGKKLTLFTDEYRTVANARRVAEGLWKFASQGQFGTWNFGGPERISRFEFGRTLARFFDLDESLVEGVSQAAVATGTPRPADVSLDSSKSFEAGYEHGTLKQELEDIRKRSTPFKNK